MLQLSIISENADSNKAFLTRLRITVYCKRISVLCLCHPFILYGFYGLYFVFVSVHTTVHTVLESGTWRLLNEL
jgi:hypothetical protein